jgi:hypothetical protein
MFDFQDLFQWDRFITPTIIKTFYWLVIGLIVLFGMTGILAALSAMAVSPFYGWWARDAPLPTLRALAPSLRAKRSNPSRRKKEEWIASSLCSSQ